MLRSPTCTIASSSSTIQLSIAPSSPCRWRPAMSAVARGTVDSRAMQSACGSGRKDRTLISRVRIWRPANWTIPDRVVGPERFELSPLDLKGRCAAITPRARYGFRGRAFELLLHRLSFGGCVQNRTESVQSTRGLQPRPEPRRSAHPKTNETAEGSSQGGSRSVSAIDAWLRVWSLPFIGAGRGARLALDTADIPLAGEVYRGPIVPYAHVSHDALAPCESRGCGRGQHGLYE